MRATYKLLIILFLAQSSFAQQDFSKDWQTKHPDVIFVKQQDYSTDLAEQFNAKNLKVIVYSESITPELIQAYTSEFEQQTSTSFIEKSAAANEIKIWLAGNEGLKIIPRSIFEGQNEEQQALILDSDAMVLEGEKITLLDIEYYENNH